MDVHTTGTSRLPKRQKKKGNAPKTTKAARSRFTHALLDPLRKRRGISSDFEFVIPHSGQTVENPPPGYLTFFYQQFEGGLTFPVHPFMCSVARFYQVPLNLLHPTAFKFMTCLYVICDVLGYSPSPELFFASFLVKAYEGSFHLMGCQGYTFLTGHTPKLRNWNAFYIYVKPPSHLPWDFPFGSGPFILNRSEPEPVYVSLRDTIMARIGDDRAFHVEQIMGNSDLVVSTGLWTIPGSKTITDRGTKFSLVRESRFTFFRLLHR